MSRQPISDFLQLLLKTHRLTIVICAPKTSTLGELKENALSALQQFEEDETEVPRVSSVDDFEINRYSSQTSQYVLLDTSEEAANTTVKDAGLKGWEKLFLQFKTHSGELMDVIVEQPPIIVDDDDDMS